MAWWISLAYCGIDSTSISMFFGSWLPHSLLLQHQFEAPILSLLNTVSKDLAQLFPPLSFPFTYFHPEETEET